MGMVTNDDFCFHLFSFSLVPTGYASEQNIWLLSGL